MRVALLLLATHAITTSALMVRPALLGRQPLVAKATSRYALAAMEMPAPSEEGAMEANATEMVVPASEPVEEKNAFESLPLPAKVAAIIASTLASGYLAVSVLAPPPPPPPTPSFAIVSKKATKAAETKVKSKKGKATPAPVAEVDETKGAKMSKKAAPAPVTAPVVAQRAPSTTVYKSDGLKIVGGTILAGAALVAKESARPRETSVVRSIPRKSGSKTSYAAPAAARRPAKAVNYNKVTKPKPVDFAELYGRKKEKTPSQIASERAAAERSRKAAASKAAATARKNEAAAKAAAAKAKAVALSAERKRTAVAKANAAKIEAAKKKAAVKKPVKKAAVKKIVKKAPVKKVVQKAVVKRVVKKAPPKKLAVARAAKK